MKRWVIAFQLLNDINENRNLETTVRSVKWRWPWSEDRMHELLLTHKRRQHLTEKESKHIARILRDYPNDLKHIQQWYKLSVSTIKNIKSKIKLKKTDDNEEEKDLSIHWDLKDEIKMYIQAYICPPCGPRTISMIQKQIELKFGEKHSTYRVKQFVKEEMSYRFKKGWSRPPKYATKRTQLIKVLYWTEFLSMLVDGKTIVNVDESSFNRSTKSQYSWLPIGEGCQIINDTLKGKVTLVLGTWSSWEWLAMIVVGTLNSLMFSVFLKLLELLFKNIYEKRNFPIVVLDNSRTHSSKFTKRIMKDLLFELRFSAPYWPEVAPVEQAFWMIKSKLRSMGGTSAINLEKPEGLAKVFQLFESIGDSSWIKAWIKVIKEAKLTILKKLATAIHPGSDTNMLEAK